METPNTERLSRDGPEAEHIGRLAIYAASLTDYNNGILHGRWIDAVEDEGVMAAEIDDMLAASPTRARTGEPAEEWAIHDHEGFEPYRVSEYASLGTIAMLAAGISEYGRAFAAWAASSGDELDEEPLRRFEDAYLGEWRSLTDTPSISSTSSDSTSCSTGSSPQDSVLMCRSTQKDSLGTWNSAAMSDRRRPATAACTCSAPTHDAGGQNRCRFHCFRREAESGTIGAHVTRRTITMTPEQATRLGAMLRQARQDQGLTIRQLEELSGVGDTTIVRIEQGTLKEPPAERLQRLALALDLPVEDVYAEAGLQMPENLPSFQPYLRAKYPSMPAEAEAELHHYFDRIARKYGFSSTGPAPGEDDDTPRSRNTTKGGTHATHQQPRRQQRPQSARGAAASRARRTPPSR